MLALMLALGTSVFAAGADKSVVVKAGDTMRFDVTKIEAVAGTTLEIKLDNNGKLPKAAMGHNLVVLKKSANPMQFANGAMMVRDTE